jgi:hypothetical protein
MVWKWRSLLPLTEPDIGSILIPGEEGQDNMYGFYLIPCSSKSLGRKTDNTIVHDMNNGNRPKRFLLSTRADNQRNWRFNVSILSPKCSETLVTSYEIGPATIVRAFSTLGQVGTKQFGSTGTRVRSI